MAVALEFINVLVRVEAIRTKFPGGWDKFLVDYEKVIGGIGWYDDHLFREGAMSPGEIGHLIDEWIANGLEVYRKENGKPVEWLDVCVAGPFGPTLKCAWFCFTDDGLGAYLRGTDPGRLMTRHDFPEFDWPTWYKNN